MVRSLGVLLLVLGASIGHAQGLEELKGLAEQDQKDRQGWATYTRDEAAAVAERDRTRRTRVKEMVAKDLLADALDFDQASLILQHGDQPEDYEAARELSIIAFALGRVNSMPALAEDRFLLALKRPQRFGAQFRLSAEGKIVLAEMPDARPPAAVSDALRLEFLQPPLAMIEKEGSEAYRIVVPMVAKRLAERWSAEFLAQAKESAESVEMRALVSGSKNEAARARVLEIYAADALRTAEDYVNAARVLTTASAPATRLLANELAALGAMRGHPQGGRVFAETWDRFVGGIGRTSRYGTRGTARPRNVVGPAVRRLFGLGTAGSHSPLNSLRASAEPGWMPTP